MSMCMVYTHISPRLADTIACTTILFMSGACTRTGCCRRNALGGSRFVLTVGGLKLRSRAYYATQYTCIYPVIRVGNPYQQPPRVLFAFFYSDHRPRATRRAVRTSSYIIEIVPLTLRAYVQPTMTYNYYLHAHKHSLTL